MEELFKEPYVECYFDGEAHVLFHIWLKRPTSEQFRNGLKRVYDEFLKHKEKHPCIHWLADTRNLGVLSLEDQGWLEKVWNEMLFVKAGVKTHAVIVGNDVFAKYAMEKFKKTMTEKYASQNLHLGTFPTKESAYTWFGEVVKKLNVNS